MNKVMKVLIIALISIVLLACNLGKMLPPSNENGAATPEAIATEAPNAAQQSPSQAVADTQSVSSLEPCSLITSAEAEAILAEPVSEAKAISGSCAYSNAKDSLYMVSAAAAQDQETSGILQGQAMMLGLAGVQLDETRMTKIKALAMDFDYKGFFTELVAAAQGAPTLKAQLVEGGGSDLVYWAWITAQSRRQGSFVAVRGQTLININLIVAETQSEEAMLAASTSLADNIFKRLPPKFTLTMPETTPPTQIVPTNTAVPPEKTVVGQWERRSSEITEFFNIQEDGTYSIEARNNNTNAVVGGINGTVTFDENNIYYVDKNNHKTTESYSLSNEGDLLVINNMADKAWTRVK